MSKKLSRNLKRVSKHRRLRNRIEGTSERPRLCVFRSARHTYAQVIDDRSGVTLASASTLKLEGRRLSKGGNVEAAKVVGKAIAERVKDKGIDSVVFDRGGYLFHGRLKALADAAREAGLKF